MNIQTFDYSIDLMKVLPWQYDNSNIRTLLEKKSEWYDENHRQFWEDWERDVFNLTTANDFGLNVWSIILNLPLYTRDDASPSNYPAFGFASFGMNFDNGNFATDATNFSNLSTDDKRLLLMLRWAKITSDGTMWHINETLYRLMGGKVYALDGLDMTITFIFTERLSSVLMNLLETYDIFPRPSGVKAKFLVVPRQAFGFADYGLNFDQTYSQFGS